MLRINFIKKTFKNVWARYKWNNKDRGPEAKGFLSKIDFKFVFLLKFCLPIFDNLQKVSKYFQRVESNMYEACVLVDSLIENLNTMDIQSIYTEAVNICNSYNIPLTSTKCIFKLPNHLKDFFAQQTALLPQSQYFLKLDILNSFATL